MIDNIYRQGKVLSRKYWLLKIAYTVLMIGFIVVGITYICALFYKHGVFRISDPLYYSLINVNQE
jgi:hypothetical protein